LCKTDELWFTSVFRAEAFFFFFFPRYTAIHPLEFLRGKKSFFSFTESFGFSVNVMVFTIDEITWLSNELKVNRQCYRSWHEFFIQWIWTRIFYSMKRDYNHGANSCKNTCDLWVVSSYINFRNFPD
jgi:hypothetical protein